MHLGGLENFLRKLKNKRVHGHFKLTLKYSQKINLLKEKNLKPLQSFPNTHYPKLYEEPLQKIVDHLLSLVFIYLKQGDKRR